jgi:phosphopantothenoylcysteine decarboxylase/phosphopantothenate--cysteine ligase
MHILITAGPTREPIDPVRYLSNHSSGKMGYALAAAALAAGHEVTLVSGPVSIAAPEGARLVRVETALEMEAAVHAAAGEAQGIIMCAAVADFRPAAIAENKLKKEPGQRTMTLDLVLNPDILAGLRAVAPHAILAGFAAETADHLEHARRKLAAKNCDLLVLNDVAQPGIGFGAEDNEVTLLYADGRVEPVPRASKRVIAEKIIAALEALSK